MSRQRSSPAHLAATLCVRTTGCVYLGMPSYMHDYAGLRRDRLTHASKSTGQSALRGTLLAATAGLQHANRRSGLLIPSQPLSFSLCTNLRCVLDYEARRRLAPEFVALAMGAICEPGDVFGESSAVDSDDKCHC